MTKDRLDFIHGSSYIFSNLPGMQFSIVLSNTTNGLQRLMTPTRCVILFSASLLLLPLWLRAFAGTGQAAHPSISGNHRAVSTPTTPQTPLNLHRADYTIAARLDIPARSVVGEEIITWMNDSRDPVSDLYLHLYMNAYRNTKSTFASEGELNITANNSGGIDINSLHIVDGADLLPNSTFVHPDDDNADDMTVLRVPLPRPVKPSESIRLHATFTTKLPLGIGRSNAAEGCDFYFVGQWFPKMAVYGAGGWNAHQFHYFTEFFADFGEYRVALTVPQNYIVGATGVRESTKENPDGTMTVTYHQADVHDFAWTASPRFLEFHRWFHHPTLPSTEIILLLQPEHRGVLNRYFSAMANALKYFGEWYGEYPYRTITVVDPPRTSHAGGMEYPTLITVGSRWIAPEKILDPEDVTVHEFGHQYWYGMVASNEFEDPWLDEGFTTYSEIRIMEKVYGYTMSSFRVAGGIPLYGLPMLTLDGFPLIAVMDKVRVHYLYDGRIGFLRNMKNDPMARWGFKQYNRETYGVNAYDKPALMLWTLEKFLGEDTMAAIMKTYFRRYRFRHPTPKDFYAVVNEVSGRDMTWFFRQVVDETCTLDYGIESMRCEEADGKYRTEVIVRRYGEMRIPVDIRLTCENGETCNDTWNGNDRWIKKVYWTTSPASVAQVDPGNKLVLDIDCANNSKKADTDNKAVLIWTSKWLFWMQHLLQFLNSLC